MWPLEKNAPPLGSHVFQANVTIFELIQDIIETNLLTKFHEDWTMNVATRVLKRLFFFNIRLFTCFHYIHIEKTAPPPGGHVFSPMWTIFELVRDINETNDLTKFHDDWAKIVTSRVFTRNIAPPPGVHIVSNVTSTVFTSFELSRVQIINVASRVFTRQNVDDGRRTKGLYGFSLKLKTVLFLVLRREHISMVTITSEEKEANAFFNDWHEAYW
ncbi:hypothetical protein DPMN_015486 [Dreissena polymorpha]|uniref:Uncharacterized protein n=1 Tax=Dreissena polymorpha TaxID=45954 RepID=A0A9D4NDQ5_DREPO|nr:hypothetical protein DPMN_015486 [Dreissena polymorpha]